MSARRSRAAMIGVIQQRDYSSQLEKSIFIAAAYAFCLPWRRPSVCRPPVSRRRSSRPRAQLRLIKTGRHSH